MASKVVSRGGGSLRNNLVLAEDGSNYVAWKTVIPVALQVELLAWEVTNETLVMPTIVDDEKPTPEEQLQIDQFNLGNRRDKHILLNSLRSTTIVN